MSDEQQWRQCVVNDFKAHGNRLQALEITVLILLVFNAGLIAVLVRIL